MWMNFHAVQDTSWITSELLSACCRPNLGQMFSQRAEVAAAYLRHVCCSVQQLFRGVACLVIANALNQLDLQTGTASK